MTPADILSALQLGEGDVILVAVTLVLIFLPSLVPTLGNAAGRFADRLRHRTPER